MRIKSMIQLRVFQNKTVRKDDFGIELTSWPATKIKAYQSAKVPGIWLMRTLVGHLSQSERGAGGLNYTPQFDWES